MVTGHTASAPFDGISITHRVIVVAHTFNSTDRQFFRSQSPLLLMGIRALQGKPEAR
jgi:hypothetical protein